MRCVSSQLFIAYLFEHWSDAVSMMIAPSVFVLDGSLNILVPLRGTRYAHILVLSALGCDIVGVVGVISPYYPSPQ